MKYITIIPGSTSIIVFEMFLSPFVWIVNSFKEQ